MLNRKKPEWETQFKVSKCDYYMLIDGKFQQPTIYCDEIGDHFVQIRPEVYQRVEIVGYVDEWRNFLIAEKY